MLGKKRFQQDNWMSGSRNGRQKREQRTFAITIGIALLVALFAFAMSRSATSLHLPFRQATTAP